MFSYFESASLNPALLVSCSWASLDVPVAKLQAVCVHKSFFPAFEYISVVSLGLQTSGASCCWGCEVDNSWAGGKSCPYHTSQIIWCHSLCCKMEFGWIWWGGYFVCFIPVKTATFLPRCVATFCIWDALLSRSVLSASSSTQRTIGSCHSPFPSSRVGLHMQTNSQFAPCSSFSSVLPKLCWVLVLCFMSQSQTLKASKGRSLWQLGAVSSGSSCVFPSLAVD